MKPHEHLIATTSGGLIVALVATPFDVIKVRMIAQTLHKHDRSCFYRHCEGVLKDVCLSCGYEHSPRVVYRGLCQREVYSGAFDAAIKISRSEGISALWNGLGPSLVMIMPSAAMYFTMFDYLRVKGKARFSEKYHNLVPSLAGITARCANIGMFSPLELVRTKIQSEQQLVYSKLRDSIKRHIKTNGVRSLWDGSKSQLFRDIPFTVVYWYLQEVYKVKLSKQGYGTLTSNCGGAVVGGTVAAIISHPFEVTKTQLQSNVGENSNFGKSGMVQQLVSIFKSGGLRGLYVGITPRMIKVLPSCAIFITTFEGLKEYFNRGNDDS